MTCAEFEKVLEEAALGRPVSPEARAHAAACPRCAFALRLESTLRDAPRWAVRPQLAVDRRATLMARARVQMPPAPWFGPGPLLEQSALNAAITLLLLGVGAYGLPPVLRGTLPAPLYDTLAREVTPLLTTLKGLVGPLLQQGWGPLVLAAAGFSLCFAAALSARLYSDLRHA